MRDVTSQELLADSQAHLTHVNFMHSVDISAKHNSTVHINAITDEYVLLKCDPCDAELLHFRSCKLFYMAQ